MKITHYIVLIITLTVTLNAFGESKIVKWVDKNGVTHYGDKRPMPEDARRASELNKEGLVVNKYEQDPSKSNEAERLNLEQSRRDAALLASYSSAEEIDIAQGRNTRLDEIALGTLNQKLENLNQRLAKNSAAQEYFKEKKKPVPENINHERTDIMSDIKQTEAQIQKKESTIEETRQRYKEDKARYVELKAKGVSYKDLKTR